MRRLLWLACLLVLFVPGAAGAEQTDDFAKALPLDRAQTGVLKPNRFGGTFAYYKFFYASDGTTATVNLQMWPDDATVLKNAGIKIFGPRPNKEYVNGGQAPGARPNVSGNVISQDPNERGVYTVQVYNYDPNTAVEFSIELAGAVAAPPPLPPAEAAAAVASPVNTTGDSALPLADRQGATLGPGGREFRYFRFDYPGDASVVSINMQVTPDEAALLETVGFHVYGPRADAAPIKAGIRHGLQPNMSVDLINREAGTYVIQVYNYDPVRAMQFSLWADGLPAPAAP